MSTVLIGYRGSGKTTVGKRLADRLWQKFVDTDDLIMAKSGGKTIRQIFDEGGEARFRELETEAVKEAVALQDVVIALGGGALLREENRKLLKESGHKLIHLKCDPAELYRRIEADPNTAANRPNLTAGGGPQEINDLLGQREPIYREMMHVELDVTNLTPEEAIVYISRML